ncbi:MAG: CYTH domain-containing protein [Clostridia bacterium]|nr:CYTH domain-containing protein [Clostridia bacterium]
MAKNVTIDGKNVEIERKFLIKMPDIQKLRKMDNYSESYIEQIYISQTGDFEGSRIRFRKYDDGKCVYFKTHKEDITGITRFEEEKEITQEEYKSLSKLKLEGSRAINKTRCCFDYMGLTVEIDIYDFCSDKAALEIELESEEQQYFIPPFIEVIAEVSGIEKYRNYSLAMGENL